MKSTDYSCLSSIELDEVVKNIKNDFPNDGEVMLQGHLSRLGFKTKGLILGHLYIVLIVTMHYQGAPVQLYTRRVYSVPLPNYVWHLDGNHKLIRLWLVIHAAVDAFSRMIVINVQTTTEQAQYYNHFLKVLLHLDYLVTLKLIMGMKMLMYGGTVAIL